MIASDNSMAIDLHDVAKTYRRKVRALRGIAMRVRRGEVFGLLGPNGAGKSTLVKIIMTVIRPTHAAGTVLGQPVGHRPTLAKLGYLPEGHRFPPYLKGRQALEYYAALAKVDRRTRKQRTGELLELGGMSKWAETKVGTYSKGMQQRIGLAQAMCNDPDLLVLDEPTDRLDPVGRREVRDVLRRIGDQGKTVFLNSHLLGEVEQLCDRVAILVEGNVVQQGTIDDLTAQGQRYEIELTGLPTEQLQSAVADALPGESGTLPSGESVELVGTTLRIGTTDPAAVQPVIDTLRACDLVIRSVRPVRQSLEDFFIDAVAELPDGSSPAATAAKGAAS